ncbi:MAG: dihydrolipoyl dehydrogenase [Magnetococcales bacterium]|nr:dihydrolipoyl dehydrogenase [Magnetococcales bacterium]
MEEPWDLVVLGAGPGGYSAAIRAAQLGFRTLCIDRREGPGGVCLHEGCIPSKALLESSRHFEILASGELAVHGIVTAPPALDVAAMMRRKSEVTTSLSRGIETLFRKYKVHWLRGEARLRQPDLVSVVTTEGERTIPARRVLLAAGGQPAELPELPVDGRRILSSRHALALERVPDHLIVVGGGAIGLELGSVWRRLGARVTVVEGLPEILPGWDEPLVRQAKRLFIKQGLNVLTGRRVLGWEADGEGIALRLLGSDGEERLVGSLVLAAAGRRPDPEAAGAAALGVERDGAGRIVVDKEYQTSLPGVYAVGDLIPGPMLAHKAMEEGVIFAERLAGHDVKLNYGAIPYVIYTRPELASVGWTVSQAQAHGLPVKSGQFPFLANGRARAAGEADGMIRMAMEETTGHLVGVHMLGPHVSELIAPAALAVAEGWTAAQLGERPFAHPTLAEALKEAALALAGKAIHA